MDGVCITDHETMAAQGLVREGIQQDGLCVIVGMEYATTQGDFLLFGPFEDLAPGLAAPDLLALVDRAGGAAVAAHPFRPGRSTDPSLFTTGLCRMVEAVNGRNPHSANEQAVTLVERHDLVGLGGSDAHSLAELGRVRVHIPGRIRGREDLIAGLRFGSYVHGLRERRYRGHAIPVAPAAMPRV